MRPRLGGLEQGRRVVGLRPARPRAPRQRPQVDPDLIAAALQDAEREAANPRARNGRHGPANPWSGKA